MSTTTTETKTARKPRPKNEYEVQRRLIHDGTHGIAETRWQTVPMSDAERIDSTAAGDKWIRDHGTAGETYRTVKCGPERKVKWACTLDKVTRLRFKAHRLVQIQLPTLRVHLIASDDNLAAGNAGAGKCGN